MGGWGAVRGVGLGFCSGKFQVFVFKGVGVAIWSEQHRLLSKISVRLVVFVA